MSERHELITAEEMADLQAIDRLLDEANNHALSGGDWGKSGEGNVTVDLGNHWERDPSEPRKPVKVEIYSYLLGPHRSHYFDNTKQALEVVQQWHSNQLNYDYSIEDFREGYVELPCLYSKIEEERYNKLNQKYQEFEAAIESGDIG